MLEDTPLPIPLPATVGYLAGEERVRARVLALPPPLQAVAWDCRLAVENYGRCTGRPGAFDRLLDRLESAHQAILAGALGLRPTEAEEREAGPLSGPPERVAGYVSGGNGA